MLFPVLLFPLCVMPLSMIPILFTCPGDHFGLELILEMQEAVDHWEYGLRASGGALVPSLSHWYLVDFKWKNGSWQYCSLADNPGELTMLDHTGTRVPLDGVDVSEARKSLGPMIAGDCNWDFEVARLLQALVDWRANFRAGHLSQSYAWYALNHTINRTIEYPMMATFTSPKPNAKQLCDLFLMPVCQHQVSFDLFLVPLSGDPCDTKVWIFATSTRHNVLSIFWPCYGMPPNPL
jgi:hypothetical protein